jgi:hypothetical protein
MRGFPKTNVRIFCFAKNRAFRSNSSDLPMQILWDFRCNQVAWASSDFALAKS